MNSNLHLTFSAKLVLLYLYPVFSDVRICSPWNGRRKYKFPINRRNFNPAVLASNRQQIHFTWCVRLGIDTNWILAFHALTFRPTLLRYWLLICLPSCYQYKWKSIKNLFNHSCLLNQITQDKNQYFHFNVIQDVL